MVNAVVAFLSCIQDEMCSFSHDFSKTGLRADFSITLDRYDMDDFGEMMSLCLR